MATKYAPEDIVGKECRFATFCPPNYGTNDLHVIKEILHLKSGEKVNNLRFEWDYKRPFYITKPGFRNHEQWKEWEHIDKVDRFVSTQKDLNKNILRALQKPWEDDRNLRKICRSPYVYGADITSTAIIKQKYMQKYKNCQTPYSVAVFDTETDMLHGTKEIILGTLTFKDKAITVIKKSFMEGRVDIINTLHKLKEKYIGKFIKDRNLNWEIVFADTAGEIVKKCMERAHEWQPDFIAIWNIDFDIPKALEALEKDGVAPEDVFCDPSVPKQYKQFKYIVGSRQLITASGVVKPRPPSAQWHSVICPASFYFIDAMCAYRQIRTGSPEEQSYKLDAILDKEFEDKPDLRKLSFAEADGYSDGEWHEFMQDQYPLEYTIYNLFDCICVELLDEQTTDLQLTLPMFAKWSDFKNFNSQPRRLVDDMDLHVFKNNHVMGTTSDEMANELDELTPALGGWITALPAHLIVDNGLRCIEENPNLVTNIRPFVADLDVAGSYPNGGAVLNTGKETTKRELCGFVDIDDNDRRTQGLNLSGGHTNAAEFCQVLFKLPTFDLLLDEMLKEDEAKETMDA
jgi:hypothetical protein